MNKYRMLTVAKRCSNLIYGKNVSLSAPNKNTFVIKDSKEFEEKVINGANPVVVYFYAEWCDVCKMSTPIVKKLLGNSDKIDLAIVDVDVEANIDLLKKFDIESIPALFAFRNSTVESKIIGKFDDIQINNLIKNLKI